jgi:hypothetical protein
MTSTIVPFPNPTPPPGTKPGSRKLRREQIMRQRGQALSADQRAEAGSMAIELVGTPRPWSADDYAAHVAMVVRIAIRSAKRRGVRLESMLSIPRGWLLDLCEAGDPACLVVHDWLMGNLAHLPDGFEDTFSAATANNKEDA